ncbi:ABC transporter ATP-binding protein [Methylocella sp.]|uniref:ABC transporter ATP-binding protein n=1 Tax=Methylocella sp. TaxID=1978226 RepID=UPI003783D811
MTRTQQTPALEGRGLVVSYHGRRVLQGLDVAIGAGGVTALCGPNGCGKSTLLRALAGVRAVDGGEVFVEGRALASMGRRERARALAMLAQAHEQPAGLAVAELVAYGRYAHRPLVGGLSQKDHAAVAQAIAAMGLEGLADRPVSDLSGGERQRAWIAMALAQECRILLLDEPTTWLDIRHQVELIDALRRLNRERGITIVAVLHDLNQAAAVADHVLLMRDGRVTHEGRPEEVLAEGPLRETFGVDMWSVEHPAGGTACLPSYGGKPSLRVVRAG